MFFGVGLRRRYRLSLPCSSLRMDISCKLSIALGNGCPFLFVSMVITSLKKSNFKYHTGPVGPRITFHCTMFSFRLTKGWETTTSTDVWLAFLSISLKLDIMPSSSNPNSDPPSLLSLSYALLFATDVPLDDLCCFLPPPALPFFVPRRDDPLLSSSSLQCSCFSSNGSTSTSSLSPPWSPSSFSSSSLPSMAPSPSKSISLSNSISPLDSTCSSLSDPTFMS